MIGLKIIKIRPLVPDLDLQMSKKRYFDIPKAKLGPNGPILMILRPNNIFEYALSNWVVSRHLEGCLMVKNVSEAKKFALAAIE